MIAHMLRMRAEVRRNAAGKDAYGHAKAPGWQIVADEVPCFVWIDSAQELVDGKVAVVHRMAGLFRKNADLRKDDQIVSVKNARGIVQFAGPLAVDAVTEKTLGASLSHKEVLLRRQA